MREVCPFGYSTSELLSTLPLREFLDDSRGHRFPTVERVSQDYLDGLVRMREYERAIEFAETRMKLAAADDPPDRGLVARRKSRLAELRELAAKSRTGAGRTRKEDQWSEKRTSGQ